MKVHSARRRLTLRFMLLAFVLGVSTSAWSEDDHGHEEHEHEAHGHEAHHEEHGHKEHGHDEPGHDEHHEEGVISISPEALKTADLAIEEAKPATLHMTLKVNGRVAPVSSKVAHITSRFAGIVKEVRKDIGQQVKVGEVLAVVESNQNLQTFEVKTLKSGLVTERHATLGEFATEGTTLFEIIDLSELWADFTVFQRDVPKLRQGQLITIEADGIKPPLRSSVHFISPIVDETTQSRLVRAVITNPPDSLAPGAFVTGEIAVGEFQVAVAVSYEALQTVEGKSVVFVREGDKFEKRELTLGRSDGALVEVLSGLAVGESYAAANSFVLKAELGKSEAEHVH